ncbi:hypothetical protein J4G52_36700 [Burkholderia cenocepacia]|uniref:hypothetical protein n=1 Tax=Burkholderia cenocepacia TaxID=95486 RepID=UPI001AA18BFD|nr:hypothetical protein [Burkholderia cenocepacia]MBO1859101.1 hypothetical protein [Burkholderia cenocepacia]MDR5645738.1 hypothetical protein [Burkholderia cenocepacia]
MNTPADGLTDPQIVLQELLDADEGVRDAFARALQPELSPLAAALAECYARWRPIRDAATVLPAPRTDLLNAFVFGALDDLIVSAKLLLAGKAAASGNVFRQAIEGVAMAVLCSTDEELVLNVRPKQGDVRGCYWERVMAGGDRLVEGQRAVQQLAWNAGALRLPSGWIDWLTEAQKLFSGVSHASVVTMSLRTNLHSPETISFGAHFDPEKVWWYRASLVHRRLLARELAEVMPYLLATMRRAEA